MPGPCAQHQLLGHFFIDLGIVGDEIGLAVELRGRHAAPGAHGLEKLLCKAEDGLAGAVGFRRVTAQKCTADRAGTTGHCRAPQKTQPLHQKDGAPLPAAMEAAAMPAGPPPQTRTSTSSYSGSAQSVW